MGTDGAHIGDALFRNEEAGFVQPCAWTPDDRYVLTLLFRKDNISQIVLIPADGGAPKVLRSLMWVYPKRMDLSPDGKYIVYDSFSKDNAGDRTLFVLSITGKGESKLIDKPGYYLFPCGQLTAEASLRCRPRRYDRLMDCGRDGGQAVR